MKLKQLLSSISLFVYSSNKEDAEVKLQHQPAVSPPPQPSAPVVKEEPKEPEGPSVEPETSPETPLPSKLEPEPKLEQVFQPGGKPQQEGADEEEPAGVEAENQLWATVEETTAEAGGMESRESTEEKEKEGGVIGG